MKFLKPDQRETLIDYIASYRAEMEAPDSFFSEKLLYAIFRTTPEPEHGQTRALQDLDDTDLIERYLDWFDIMPDEYPEDALVASLVFSQMH